MLTIEELTAALNDPTSPMREKLLQHLERSPLDPAQAYQQVMQESGLERGGLPPEVKGQETSMAGILGTAQPLGLESFQPLPQTPPQDLSRGANPAGVVNLANSAEVMPQGGLMPQQQPGTDPAQLAKMFEGLGGLAGGEDGYRPPPHPGAVSPQGNRWNTFQAAQLQTPGVGRMPTLAELLGRR